MNSNKLDNSLIVKAWYPIYNISLQITSFIQNFPMNEILGLNRFLNLVKFSCNLFVTMGWSLWKQSKKEIEYHWLVLDRRQKSFPLTGLTFTKVFFKKIKMYLISFIKRFVARNLMRLYLYMDTFRYRKHNLFVLTDESKHQIWMQRKCKVAHFQKNLLLKRSFRPTANEEQNITDKK